MMVFLRIDELSM